jgi:hypothetical protein
MDNLILSRQTEKETKVSTQISFAIKRLSRFVKPVVFAVVYAVFIAMSIQNDNLFIKEMLLCGGIISILYFIHLLSQKQ